MKCDARFSPFLLCTLHCALCTLLSGCRNPLGSDAADYRPRPSGERLRAIEALDRDKYATPAPAPEAASSMAPTLASALHAKPAGKLRIVPLD